jgi:EAL domain-containing protein (putative c-di-GMP-specific phosphodiesterase class I)
LLILAAGNEMKKRKVSAFKSGAGASQDPLSYAVSSRDKHVLDMVANAVVGRETMLAFQPVVRTDKPGQIAFYEGLIRVLDATGRVIPAKQFIEVIEGTDLGLQIDCLALEHGFDALDANPALRLSINMSAHSIGHTPWQALIDQRISRNPLVAERLILEITESSALVKPDLVNSFMGALQDQGIAFALDDFGAGYSSFSYLRDFYFDILKIDRKFIHGIHADIDNQALLSALIGIGQHFEMFTVAEGVETVEDATYLAKTGIDCIQGYYYGAPQLAPPGLIDSRTARSAV